MGLDESWTHRDLYEKFKEFGEVSSAKVSIGEGHKSRRFGFVMFTRDEFAQRAMQEVMFRQNYSI
jgi:RNA recognition motif-containing protein